MMEELYAKFLPQFVELARQRMRRARDAAAHPDAPALAAVARELHAIAGEAGLLGLASIVPIARGAEERAKQLRDGRDGADPDALASALDELGTAIEAASAPKPGSSP